MRPHTTMYIYVLILLTTQTGTMHATALDLYMWPLTSCLHELIYVSKRPHILVPYKCPHTTIQVGTMDVIAMDLQVDEGLGFRV
jgi:hypothetical protein